MIFSLYSLGFFSTTDSQHESAQKQKDICKKFVWNEIHTSNEIPFGSLNTWVSSKSSGSFLSMLSFQMTFRPSRGFGIIKISWIIKGNTSNLKYYWITYQENILKTLWTNPENNLRTSMQHLENIWRTSKIISQHVWTSGGNIWTHLEHIWECL